MRLLSYIVVIEIEHGRMTMSKRYTKKDAERHQAYLDGLRVQALESRGYSRLAARNAIEVLKDAQRNPDNAMLQASARPYRAALDAVYGQSS